MSVRREEILDAAERLVRRAGYAGVSTRAVAEEVGIRAASLHHHFPTKSDLGEALTDRYTERFMEKLGPPEEARNAPAGPVSVYCDAFRESLRRDGALCLCGVLGAEMSGLPVGVAENARTFFARNLNWLTEALREPGAAPAHSRAVHILSALEGAMMLTVAMEESSVIDAVCSELIAANQRTPPAQIS
ncbi:MAG: TetR/AcrR family transcriptional regulator [Pseudomonadota bacterium]